MRSSTLLVSVCVIVCLQYAASMPVDTSLADIEQESPAIDPLAVAAEEDAEDRDKRGLELKAAKKFGIKNFILDLVFGKVNQVIDYKTRLVTQLDRTNRYKNYYLLNLGSKPGGVLSSGGAQGRGGGGGRGRGGGGGEAVSTTTEDVPVFDSNRVSLDLPPQLFGSGFSLITNVSKVVGEVILNTAQRTQRFVETLKPIFGSIFKIETNAIDRSKRGSDKADVARIAEALEFREMQESQRSTLGSS